MVVEWLRQNIRVYQLDNHLFLSTIDTKKRNNIIPHFTLFSDGDKTNHDHAKIITNNV